VLLWAGLVFLLCTFYIPGISSASTLARANAIQSFTAFSTTDTDGDGIPEDNDSCPGSDLLPTVIVNGCDAGVTNVLFDTGCTMRDLIAECYAKSNNHGDFVSCAEDLSNDWRTSGLIPASEQRDLKTCVSNSNIQSDSALITGTVFDDANGTSCQADVANNITTTTDPTITADLATTTVLSPSSKTTPIPLPLPRCTADADCDDGFFCNGVETCVDGVCQKGESPCDAGQICREDVQCVDIVQLSASTALLPRRDEQMLPVPILQQNICYWLRVKIKTENNVDLNKSVFSVEGDSQNYAGVSIDSTRFKKIRTAFPKKNRGNVFWVPIEVQKNTAPGTLKIKITTDKTDAQQPFIEIVEGTFIIRENLFEQ
jgi:hypothetical protein